MKFLFIIRYGNLGGTERATLGLIQGLRRQGHECAVVITARVKALGPALVAENIKPICLDRRGGTWSTYKAICKLSAEIQPDVFVQVGSRFATTLAAFTSKARHKAYICHHHHKGEKSRLNWLVNYAVVRRAFDSLIFVSDWLRHEAVSLNSAIKARAHVLYPPVTLKEPTTDTMRRSARALLDLPQQAKIIGNAGRLMPVKRFDVFLRVAAKVARQIPEARFVVAGTGPEKEKLVLLAQSLGLEDRLIWLPWQESLEPFFRSLDVLLFNTDLEAFGLMPCEAAAHGIPAVCSIPNGGVPEIMPGHGRYCLDHHDEARLAESVVALCDQPDTGHLEAFRSAIRRHCSSDATVNSFLKIIDSR